MSIITYGLNKIWTSGITKAITKSESKKATKIFYICYGRDDIMIWDYHLQWRYFQDTNWMIQSINQGDMDNTSFMNAGTHFMVLSQYISVPAKLPLLTGIHYQSLWWYGMDSELRMDLLDVPILIYVVPNCHGLGPKPGNGRSVTVPVLPSTKQYTSLAASIMDCPRASSYADAIVHWKHVCSARYATETIVVRSPSPQATTFWTDVGHTSPRDTNSGTAWSLLSRQRFSWHSPNGLGLAPLCWKLQYQDLWMRHREPAEVVTLWGWMCEQEALAIVAAEGGPHGNPEWLLPARRDTKTDTGQRGLALLWGNH